MRRPLVSFALLFSLGIIAADRITISLPLAYSFLSVFLIFSFIFFKKRLIFDVLISCLIFTLGITLLKDSQELPKCHISKFIYHKYGQPHIVKGVIASEPLIKNNKTSFVFKAREIQADNLNRSCCGNIIVNLKGKKDFSYGEELILRGPLHRPVNNLNSSGASFREYLSNQGIYFIMAVKTERDYARLNKNKGFWLKRLAIHLKLKTEGLIFRKTSFLTAAILDAMILGEKINVPWFLNSSMMRSGTIHILVVSGFNVGIVAFIIILLLKVIRLPRKIRFTLTILCLILYCLITGASNPVVRATVMAVIFLLAYLFKREPDIYNALSLAAISILAFNPRQLFDIGFQLSFVSVFSLIYIYPKAKSLLRIDNLKVKYLKFIMESCLVSFSCWLGTMGFIAYYFRIFSPITVLANLVIVPIATLITLCGFSLVIISLFLPSLAVPFASTSELLVALLVEASACLVRLPMAYFHF